MTIDLLLDNLSVSEKRIITQFAAHIRTLHRQDVAPFLFEQLQAGRAYILDVNSVEFKGLTKWQ